MKLYSCGGHLAVEAEEEAEQLFALPSACTSTGIAVIVSSSCTLKIVWGSHLKFLTHSWCGSLFHGLHLAAWDSVPPGVTVVTPAAPCLGAVVGSVVVSGLEVFYPGRLWRAAVGPWQPRLSCKLARSFAVSVSF